MWWPFKMGDPKKEELSRIDARIAYHKASLLGLCKVGKSTSKKARLHRRLYYLLEARRLEFIDDLEGAKWPTSNKHSKRQSS